VLDLTQRNVGRTLFALALVAAAIAVGSSYFTGARITRPIIALTGAARRVREGDLEARAQVEGADEVSTLGDTFNEMVSSLGKLTGDLRSAATQLETILQSLTDGVVAVDDQGHVVAFNREAVRITGRRENEAKGRKIEDVLVATDGSGGRISLPVYGLEAGAISNAFVSVDSDSIRTPVAITSAPIRNDNGGVVGAVAVLHDLTSELALEKAKTEFLSSISHELNTPLTPIKGYAEMLRRRKVPRAKAVSMLDAILASTRRLKRIVDLLIDVSSMEAGHLTVRREPLELGKITAQMVKDWKREAPKHRFERRGFRNLPRIEADRRLLPRAIDELIDNAVKFSPKGGRVSLVADVGRSRGARSLRITVADRGIGISESKLAEIFEEFTQVDASDTRPYGGLGLGLAYVRRVVEAHGGHLEVKSDVRRGSRFSIILAIAGGTSRQRPVGRNASTRASRRPISGKKA
jgi:PAS domain S-box-containing protein